MSVSHSFHRDGSPERNSLIETLFGDDSLRGINPSRQGRCGGSQQWEYKVTPPHFLAYQEVGDRMDVDQAISLKGPVAIHFLRLGPASQSRTTRNREQGVKNRSSCGRYFRSKSQQGCCQTDVTKSPPTGTWRSGLIWKRGTQT